MITGTGSVTVTGAGSTASPYVINGGGSLGVVDTSTINFTLTGNGSVATPYSITAVATLTLDDLTNVEAAAATTGQVIARQSDGVWRPVAASSASPGTINVSGGIEGDGSAGTPLSVKLPASSGLIEDSTGLRVEGAAAWTAYTPTMTSEGSGSDPTLGNGTLSARWSRTGKTVNCVIMLTAGSTTKRGVGTFQLTLPVAAYSPPTHLYQVGHFTLSVPGVGTWLGSCLISDTLVYRTYIPYSTGLSGAFAGAVPSTFPSASVAIWSFTYEAA